MLDFYPHDAVLECYLSPVVCISGYVHVLQWCTPECRPAVCLSSVSVCLSVCLCLSVYTDGVRRVQCVCLSVCLCVCTGWCTQSAVRLSVCVCLSVCFPVCLSVCMSDYVSVCVCTGWCTQSAVHLSVSLSVCLTMCLSVCLCVCVYRMVYTECSASVCFPVCLSVCMSDYVSVCVCVYRMVYTGCSASVCFPVCLSVSLSVCLTMCLCVCTGWCTQSAVHLSVRVATNAVISAFSVISQLFSLTSSSHTTVGMASGPPTPSTQVSCHISYHQFIVRPLLREPRP